MFRLLKSNLFFIGLTCLISLAHAEETLPATNESQTEDIAQDFPVSYVIHDGLIWTPTTKRFTLNWSEADAYCRNTIIHGMKGWRLPTVDELKVLHRSKETKNKGWLLDRAWSSTPHRKGDHFSVGLKLGFSNWTNDNLKLLTTCVYEFKEH